MRHHEPSTPPSPRRNVVPIAPAEQERSIGREIAAEREVARIATAQHGMITTAQLARAGFGRTQITRRAAGGWLVRRHVGVYLLGVVAGPFGDEMAALLACGPEAVISHWTSIRVFELAKRDVRGIHVSALGRLPGRRPGIHPHRALTLPACDVVVRHGLRVTTPARTLLDIASSTPRAELERLVEEVQVQRLASPAELLAVIGRGAGRPGVRRLRA